MQCLTAIWEEDAVFLPEKESLLTMNEFPKLHREWSTFDNKRE